MMSSPGTQLVLRLADSEVSSVVASGRDLLVRLSAAHVESGGVPGFARGVVLTLQDGHAQHPGELAFGRLRDGVIRQSGQRASGCDLPSSWPGPAELDLEFANGTSLHVNASGLRVAFDGEPNFRESLAC